MNTHVTPLFSDSAPQPLVLPFKRDVLRCAGNIRAVTLGRHMTSKESFFGMKEAIQESIEKTFGKITEAPG